MMFLALPCIHPGPILFIYYFFLFQLSLPVSKNWLKHRQIYVFPLLSTNVLLLILLLFWMCMIRHSVYSRNRKEKNLTKNEYIRGECWLLCILPVPLLEFANLKVSLKTEMLLFSWIELTFIRNSTYPLWLHISFQHLEQHRLLMCLVWILFVSVHVAFRVTVG